MKKLKKPTIEDSPKEQESRMEQDTQPIKEKKMYGVVDRHHPANKDRLEREQLIAVKIRMLEWNNDFLLKIYTQDVSSDLWRRAALQVLISRGAEPAKKYKKPDTPEKKALRKKFWESKQGINIQMQQHFKRNGL